MTENKWVLLLLVFLIILCFLSVCLNRKTATVFEPETDTSFSSFEPVEEEISISEMTEEDEEPSIYGLSGYIFKNSNAFCERLKSEVNNLANDTCDRDHLYDVAASIRLNEISYYTMLNGRYEEGDFDLVEACKSYCFNVETMAANIMKFIEIGRTKYISRCMICISSDEQLKTNFYNAQSAYYNLYETETTTAAAE
ncbi:MAG: hypothetical protein LUG66_09785 [Clostridiales bacterium]|nr:hypothetical protein [Clostridiales bacterium]